jgi:isopentenyl-diphosphate Delta-isomerase
MKYTKLFPTGLVNKKFSVSKLATKDLKESLLKKFHPSQSKTMDEDLILVDENDKPIDSLSKIEAHLKIKNNKYPHRAFSVFLFNDKNELLLQKRSSQKVTFPNLWSNTCCSHPLNTVEEKQTENNIGIKKAAVRRMKFEFGIDTMEQDYLPYEKILYRADSDEVFEEFELDYILLSKINFDIDYIKRVMNQDEVSDAMFIKRDELVNAVKDEKLNVTPWFKLIIQNRYDQIYEYVQNNNKLDKGIDLELKTINFI